MKKMFVTAIAVCLYQMNAVAAAVASAPAASSASAPAASTPAPVAIPAGYDIPAECKGLALMTGQMMGTGFYDKAEGGRAHDPSTLELKANSGLVITQMEYLGGDGEDTSGPNAGKYPCDLDSTLCTTPGDAGGPVDYARVTVRPGPGVKVMGYASVVISYGSRGGCVVDSAKNLVQ